MWDRRRDARRPSSSNCDRISPRRVSSSFPAFWLTSCLTLANSLLCSSLSRSRSARIARACSSCNCRTFSSYSCFISRSIRALSWRSASLAFLCDIKHRGKAGWIQCTIRKFPRKAHGKKDERTSCSIVSSSSLNLEWKPSSCLKEESLVCSNALPAKVERKSTPQLHGRIRSMQPQSQ